MDSGIPSTCIMTGLFILHVHTCITCTRTCRDSFRKFVNRGQNLNFKDFGDEVQDWYGVAIGSLTSMRQDSK